MLRAGRVNAIHKNELSISVVELQGLPLLSLLTPFIVTLSRTFFFFSGETGGGQVGLSLHCRRHTFEAITRQVSRPVGGRMHSGLPDMAVIFFFLPNCSSATRKYITGEICLVL